MVMMRIFRALTSSLTQLMIPDVLHDAMHVDMMRFLLRINCFQELDVSDICM